MSLRHYGFLLEHSVLRFQGRSAELQIPRYARNDRKERVAEGRGLLPREKAFVGATGTPSIDSSPFRAKAKKSQALGMTKRRGLLKGRGPWGAGRLFYRQPLSTSTHRFLCE